MEQLKAFIEKAKSDNELTEKLNRFGEKGAGADEYIKIAAEYGFTITEDEFEKANKANELSEEQLEDIAGGTSDWARHHCCWFTPTGKRRGDNNEIFLECNSSCKNLFTNYMCYCHGTGYCSAKWHRFSDTDNRLILYLETNHLEKAPPSFNT